MLPGLPDPARVILQPLAWPLPSRMDVAMLRLDLLHPEVSGNKWFKLKYNIAACRSRGCDTLATFGGPWSNHIAATAAACRLAGLQAIGIIRGQEPPQRSRTLQQAEAQGMRLVFLPRSQYKERMADGMLAGPEPALLGMDPAKVWWVPEGGDNAEGLRGCREILSLQPCSNFTHIACPLGTGTTLRGLQQAAAPGQQLMGFAPLKNAGALQEKLGASEDRALRIFATPTWGRFANPAPGLLAWMRQFRAETGVLLDMVYTARMMYALQDLSRQGYFPEGCRLLVIHTGGLQGNYSLADLSLHPN